MYMQILNVNKSGVYACDITARAKDVAVAKK